MGMAVIDIDDLRHVGLFAGRVDGEELRACFPDRVAGEQGLEGADGHPRPEVAQRDVGPRRQDGGR